MKISKLMPNILEYKWIKLITISIYNNVENELIDYFLELYKLYIETEQKKDICYTSKKYYEKKCIIFSSIKKAFCRGYLFNSILHTNNFFKNR